MTTGSDRGCGHKPQGAWAPRSWQTQEGPSPEGSTALLHCDLSPGVGSGRENCRDERPLL